MQHTRELLHALDWRLETIAFPRSLIEFSGHVAASVDAYIALRANLQQAADCRMLMALFKEITKQSPMMWGPSIVDYGSYKYIYESGRTGEAPLAGFAIRSRDLVVYPDCEGSTE